MKNLLALFVIVVTVSSCCFSQIPTQYVYVDSNCSAVLPDYTPIVIVSDNCEVAALTQSPEVGSIISTNTEVTITAIDGSGNTAWLDFDVVLLDTIPPTIMLNPDWAYTDQEVGDMYRTFYGHVQLTTNQRNGLLPIPIELADSVTVYIRDSVKVWTNTIVIPDTVRQDWWWATTE